MEPNFSIPENAIQTSEPFLNEERFPLMIKWVAHLFSFIFHPLFIPLIATWFLAYIQPGYFTGISLHDKFSVMIQVGFNTIFYPALIILLLKAVGFIKSIFLKTQRERIVPYITSNICYFWMFWVFKNEPDVPVILTGFMFGIFLVSSAGLIANIYFKISMHAMGMGALCGLMLIIIFSGFSYPVFLFAMLVFIITGLVGTSRLILSDHWPSHIYSGIFISIICQLVAYGIFG